MNIADKAKAAGFTKYECAGGWRDVELFNYRNCFEYEFSESEKAFLGPWRAPTTYELACMDAKGIDTALFTKARNKFALI